MRPRERGKALAGRRGQFFDADRRTAAECNDAGRQRKQNLESKVHLPEQQFLPLLGALTLRDIPGNLGCANYFVRMVSDRRNGQGYIEETSVLAHANRFVVVDPFATTDALENHGFFIPPIGGNEDGNRLPYGFLGRIAEEPFRAAVPACDHAVEVFGENGVIGKFNDCGVVLPSAIVSQTIAAIPSLWGFCHLFCCPLDAVLTTLAGRGSRGKLGATKCAAKGAPFATRL